MSEHLRRLLTIENVSTFGTLLRYFNVKPDWDYLIVCDGSGTKWDKEIGWGSTLVNKKSLQRQIFHGALSNGTNNVAEIMGVLHPLLSIVSTTRVPNKGLDVYVLSDSEYVCRLLEKDDSSLIWALDSNRELWLAIWSTRRRGIRCIPKHVPRNSFKLHECMHDLANMARINQQPIKVDEICTQINEANPDE